MNFGVAIDFVAVARLLAAMSGDGVCDSKFSHIEIRPRHNQLIISPVMKCEEELDAVRGDEVAKTPASGTRKPFD